MFNAWGLTNSRKPLWAFAPENMEGLMTVPWLLPRRVVYPANILAAVLAHIDRFYIAHNHPSGSVASRVQLGGL